MVGAAVVGAGVVGAAVVGAGVVGTGVVGAGVVGAGALGAGAVGAGVVGAGVVGAGVVGDGVVCPASALRRGRGVGSALRRRPCIGNNVCSDRTKRIALIWVASDSTDVEMITKISLRWVWGLSISQERWVGMWLGG